MITQRVLIVAAVYTALIIIKTMFESVGVLIFFYYYIFIIYNKLIAIFFLKRLFVALYGHGFCSYLRFQMFRKILRHGLAYFNEECNSPGRLVHKVITDTASLNRVNSYYLYLFNI